MKILHDDSERSLALLARAYYKLSECFWKDCMANAIFCYLEMIIAVIKVDMENWIS